MTSCNFGRFWPSPSIDTRFRNHTYTLSLHYPWTLSLGSRGLGVIYIQKIKFLRWKLLSFPEPCLVELPRPELFWSSSDSRSRRKIEVRSLPEYELIWVEAKVATPECCFCFSVKWPSPCFPSSISSRIFSATFCSWLKTKYQISGSSFAGSYPGSNLSFHCPQVRISMSLKWNIIVFKQEF